MAKKTYIGVNNASKEGKKFYIGVGNIAKKVKKMYLGVNGVAKLVYEFAAWSYGNPQYISSYTKTSGSLSGYSTMPDFDPDTGWFTAVGSKGSYSLGTLGSSWVYTTVYNASDLHYVEMEKIIDTSQTTSYTDSSWSYVSYEQDIQAVGFYGYGYASVDPDTGEWVGSAYNHYGVMEGDYGSVTFYQISGNTCYQITLDGDGKEVWMTTYKATSVATTTTTYTIGTYRIYAVEN